ncbi:TPA: lipopolysaccharide biosynthesis protein [Clostridium perfringens]|nr:lipopolysaccharide biosynthesis protein [Clostridium perfringens]HAT4284986.1 lipopolysaccharide biosynthesis protein [Clostridium perfringens]
MEKKLGLKAINATKWSTITEGIAKIVVPITNMILARIVTPKAFGVVATVTMIISFVDMLSEAGFQKYLIQNNFKSEKEKYDTANVAFWSNFFISVVLLILIIIFRNGIANLVGNPGLGHVIAIASIQLIITSFSSIQIALFKRDLNFKNLFIARMFAICVPFLVTIPLALNGFEYWSMIIGSIIIQISTSIILTIRSKWKPKIFFEFDILKKMFSFGSWSLIESISVWLSVWIDVLIIGSAFNDYYLGLYKTTTSMVSTVLMLITSIILPVFFSVLSRLQHDEKGFNKIFYKTQKMIAIFVLPLGTGIFLYSKLATQLLLGSQWIMASEIVGITSLTISLKIVLGDICSEVYRAKGQPKLSFKVQILHLILLIPTCIISSKYGFWVFVYARALIRLQFIVVHLIVVDKKFGISIKNIIKNIKSVVISTIIMSCVVILLKEIDNNLIWQIISIIVASFIYFIILYSFKSIKEDIKYIRSLIN